MAHEICDGIRSGRFKPTNEVQPEGSTDWTPLGGHPKFYDEFLKVMFEDKYEVSEYRDSFVALAKPESQSEKTGLGAHIPKESGDERSPSQEDNRAGLTVHQSEIDSLFSEIEELPSSDNTRIHSVENPRIDSSDRDPEPGISKRQFSLKKVVLASIALLMLFYFLGNPPSMDITSDKEGVTGVSEMQKIHQVDTIGQREGRYAFLMAEAQELFRLDLPAFLDHAEERLNEAIRLDATHADAYAQLALVLSRLYSLSPSILRPSIADRLKVVLQRGRAIEPQLSVFYVAEGEIALANHDLAEARKSLSYADQTGASNYLARQLSYELQLESAADSSNSEAIVAPQAPPSHQMRLNLLRARKLRDSNDLIEARTILLESLGDNPIHVRSYLLLGEVFAVQNDLSEAKSAFETAGRLSTLDPVMASLAYRRLGEVFQTLGQRDLALRSLRFALHFGSNGEEIDRIAGQHVVVSPEIGKEAARDAYDFNYFFDQARVLFAEKNYPAASLFFRTANRLNPSSIDCLIKLGSALEAQTASPELSLRAGEFYREAKAANEESVEVLIKLGTLETDLFHFSEAFLLLERAARLQPKSVEPVVALGKHFFKRQDYQAALEYFLEAKKMAPLNSEVLYFAGLLIMKYSKEQSREAMTLFYRAYTLDPQNTGALIEWLRLKVIHYEKNFAIKFVMTLIEQDPENANLPWALGDVYFAANEIRRAIRYYHQALDIDNRHSKARMALGKALAAVGEESAAAEEFRLSSKLNYRNGEGYYMAAEINIGLKRLKKAEQDLTSLVKAMPSYPGAHRQMARVFHMRGDQDRAKKEMRAEVVNNPVNIQFRQEFAELLYSYGNYEQAASELSYITTLPGRDKAPEYTRDKIRAYLWLSRVYRARNIFDSAEAAIRLAMEMDANDAELIRERAFVLQGSGRDKEAVAMFQNYLKRNPAAADAEEIKKLISRLAIEE